MTAPGPDDRFAAFDESLAGNITRTLFLTINVSDLDRSVEFYERTYPVRAAERVEMEPQPLLGLGIERGRFRGRVMRDSQPFQGRAILLVQWLDPAPTGRPYRSANNLGYYRHHANASRNGLRARYEDVVAAGGRPYGPPTSIEIMGTHRIDAFGFRDPDGTTLEWIGPMDPTPDGPPDSLTAHNSNCSDLAASHRWYERVLGLKYVTRLRPSGPQPADRGSLGDSLRKPDGTEHGGEMDFEATILHPWADDRNPVDLLEWTEPGSYGEPYADATNLGTQSVTYGVTDVGHVHHKLGGLLADASGSIVHEPEIWDLGELGRRRVLNIVDPDGIRIQFMEHGRPPRSDPPSASSDGSR